MSPNILFTCGYSVLLLQCCVAGCIIFAPTCCSLQYAAIYHNMPQTSVVTMAGICNSVGGGVLFDIPPRWRWPVQYAPCIACQSSVPFPSPHASSQRTRQPPPPLLIIRCSTTRRDRCGGRSRDRSPQSRRRWPRSTAHNGTPWRWPTPSSQACCL